MAVRRLRPDRQRGDRLHSRQLARDDHPWTGAHISPDRYLCRRRVAGHPRHRLPVQPPDL